MSSESENKLRNNKEPNNAGSLCDCLVDGDADQRARERNLRRRSLVLSVFLQILALAALVLVPILSRTERIALANVTLLPPYHHAARADRTSQRHHTAPQTREFSFCLKCAPTAAHLPTPNHDPGPVGVDPIGIQTGNPNAGECSECNGLIGKSGAQPIVPDDPTPHIVHMTHLDLAMLIHRVEPVFPTLPRQTGREGHVELQAIIATDGSIRSLHLVGGDALFYQSALDAVRQWRYKPTFLNGKPVEVDTHITVIYKLNR